MISDYIIAFLRLLIEDQQQTNCRPLCMWLQTSLMHLDDKIKYVYILRSYRFIFVLSFILSNISNSCKESTKTLNTRKCMIEFVLFVTVYFIAVVYRCQHLFPQRVKRVFPQRGGDVYTHLFFQTMLIDNQTIFNSFQF